MNNDLTASVNAKCGLDAIKSEALFSAFADIIKETLLSHDTVALPGFGTFTTSKTEERVIVDELTGKPQLVPPSVNVVFIPAIKLAKSVKQ